MIVSIVSPPLQRKYVSLYTGSFKYYAYICVMEIYREVEGYGGKYRVSSRGSVQVNRRGIWREPTPKMDADGKLSILLSLNGVDTIKRVHILVAEQFLEGPKGSLVKHINGDVTDNRVENLKWANRSQSGMTNKDVQSIRQAYEEQNISQRALAERYNVSPMTIHDIVTRKTWKHVK